MLRRMDCRNGDGSKDPVTRPCIEATSPSRNSPQAYFARATLELEPDEGGLSIADIQLV